MSVTWVTSCVGKPKILDAVAAVNWRKIPISLIVPQKGEQTAQTCAIA